MTKTQIANITKEANQKIKSTLQVGDAEKWAAYRVLPSQGQLGWREREGHGEFCRLQRLAFRAFI